MPIIRYPILFILLILSGCSQDLRFHIRFDADSGLAAGDRLTLDDRPIGEVTEVEAAPDGGQVLASPSLGNMRRRPPRTRDFTYATIPKSRPANASR